jgi:hypothetical protein
MYPCRPPKDSPLHALYKATHSGIYFIQEPYRKNAKDAKICPKKDLPGFLRVLRVLVVQNGDSYAFKIEARCLTGEKLE